MTPIESAKRCIDTIREKSDSVILFLSLGKDSLVLLDMLYPRFKRVVCVFMYFVPGLEHIERWIRWAEGKYPGIEVMRIPHWNLTYILRTGLYSAPQSNIKLLKLSDVITAVRLKTGLEYVFLGMKKADGMNRLLMLKRYESENYIHAGVAYPLAEWNQREILAYMLHRGLPEPVRYSLNASGGVGFNEACFLWMKEHCPADLEKIYKVFPMSERILFEAHRRRVDERKQ